MSKLLGTLYGEMLNSDKLFEVWYRRKKIAEMTDQKAATKAAWDRCWNRNVKPLALLVKSQRKMFEDHIKDLESLG